MKKIWKFFITFGIGAVFALVIMFAKGVVAANDTKTVMQILSDAFFVPGVVIAGFGLLVFASNGGAFDMLAYGVKSFFSFFQPQSKRERKKYKDFYEYRKAKQENKQEFGFIVLAGVAHIVIAVIFLLFYFQYA